MSFRDGSDTTSSLALVQELKAAHPSITILLPPSSSSSPEADRDGTFAAFQKCYISEPDRQPIAIARPRCEAEVALLVTSCAQLGLPFVVRAGGHDLAARSQVNGALVLDLREICHVSIDEENEKDSGGQRTARLGGGCLSSGVLAGLEPWGLVTPTGTISSVGYVGWAFTGGYGPLSSLFGPGVDQIVGARLVTGSGEVVVAGERVLRGLRGAAGALGVVVEVTIKVYPLKQVLAGTFIWSTGDDHQSFIKSALRNLSEICADGLPPALNPIFSIWENSERSTSSSVLVVATWASDDHETGQHWLARIKAIISTPPDMSSVQACTLLEAIRANDDAVGEGARYGRCHAVKVRGEAVAYEGLVDVLAEHTTRFGGARGAAISMHRLVGPGTVASSSSGEKDARVGEGDVSRLSVWGPRDRHTVLEILSNTTHLEDVETALSWGRRLRDAVVEVVPILKEAWLAMVPDEEDDLETLFGQDNYRFLLGLKKELDPQNVFRNTVPKLVV